jgi:hypothetical protein
MVNYNNAKIYKIIDNTTDSIYIGSTCELTLARRLAGHVSAYKLYLNGKLKFYMTSFEILKNDNYDIILIADCPCKRKDQLHLLERHYIEHNICVNKAIPIRKLEEHQKYQKEYQKEYEKNNCEKLQKYRQKRHQNNKEKLNEISRDYHQENKNKINKQKKQKHDCCCGGKFTTTHRATHCRTKQHVTFMNNKIERQYQYCVELYETTKNL